MATALKLRSDIKKLKKALDTKGISASIKDKLKSQLAKAENELASMKKGKKPTVSSTGGTKTALTKLQSLIKKKKFGVYQGQGVDLKKDADRPALPTGKRKSKSGNTYYEYRANRIDVKQPPKRFPKLEDGGMMAEGGKYLRTLPTQEDFYAFMILGKQGYGSILDGRVYNEDETKIVKDKFENKLDKGQELKMFSVKELLERKSLPTDSKKRIEESFKDRVDSVKKVMENLGIHDYKKLGYLAGGGKIEVGDKVKYKNAKYHATVERVIYDEPIPYAEIRYADGKEGKAYLEDLQKVDLRMAKEYVNPNYMAGGGNVSKSYEKIEGTDYELKIQVYYDKGGMNYFTSRPEARGYYLSVSPVQVERRDNGIMVESYAAFSGIKALVLPVQRQSPKAEKQAEELAQKMMPELKEQVTSNLKRKLGMMKEGGMMEMREVISEEQQMAKGGQIDDLLAKQTEFLAQLTDIKLGADLETEEGVLNYRNQIAPIREKLSVIEDELEMLGYEAYEKGGYMKKGGLTLGDISKKYDENEDINYHTENVVLLATHFGTADELRDAKTIKAKHDAIGHLPFNLYQERNELGDKLYKRMEEQIRENGMGAKPKKMAKGGYMAKGGEMHRYEKGGYMAGGGEEPTYDSAGFTRQDDSRIIIKSGNNGKLKEIFNEYKNQKNELKANEVFENEKMNGNSVFLFVNDELYDQYIQKSDEEEYADGGYMTDGGELSKEDFLNKSIVYDNGGESLDRYTVYTPDGSVYGISETGSGFNQYLGEADEVPQGKHLGKKLKSVPKEIETAVLSRMEYEKGGYMAKGGALEHGLKKGDHIMVIKGNMLGIKNEITGDVVTLNIETGERKETKE